MSLMDYFTALQSIINEIRLQLFAKFYVAAKLKKGSILANQILLMFDVYKRIMLLLKLLLPFSHQLQGL